LQVHPLNPETYLQIGHLSPKIKTLKNQITINKSENPYQYQPKTLRDTRDFLVGGFNPIEKYWSSSIISPNFGVKKKYVKPPTSFRLIKKKSPKLLEGFWVPLRSN